MTSGLDGVPFHFTYAGQANSSTYFRNIVERRA